MKKKHTGERMETHIFSKNTIEHLHRYSIATEFIVDKFVLDIACGEGYGAFLMSKQARKVYGVDISDEVILEAKKKYNKRNIEFLEGTTSKIPLSNNSIDIVVSFETIEHHDKHEEMMIEILRVMKSGGVLIISSPDRFNYSEVNNFKNPFHVKELFRDEFENLMAKYFKYTYSFSQKFTQSSLIMLSGLPQNSELKVYTGDFEELTELDFHNMSRFNICIASNSPIDENKMRNSVFINEDIMNNYIQSQIEIYKQSFSYRLGNSIIRPFSKIYSFLNKD